MTTHAVIFAETPVRLWGLSSRQRLERILKKMKISSWLDDPAAAAAGDSVLLLRGDYLYDERLLHNLAKKAGDRSPDRNGGWEKGRGSSCCGG